MFYKRNLAKTFKRYQKFPVIALLGPRQSGKTTLSTAYFKKHHYINLENPELRLFAIEDPKRFLKEFENAHGVIIDEFQYAPDLLSYIQVEVDEKKRPGYFILTGSQNFLINEAITQSLAGRVGILTLLPLSLNELKKNKLLTDIDTTLLNGSYPRLYENDIAPIDFYPSYIHTYLERDVRTIANVGSILTFQKLMKLLAARIGGQLNIVEMATQLGISQQKTKEWLSVLEASYIIFLLQPHFKNFNKRVTKTPKVYFYDTGLACNLLEIKSARTLALSPYRGNLFESLIISDFQKQFYNAALGTPSTYYWRDQNGRIEIDCLLDRGDLIYPIEIKSGATLNPSFFDGITAWNKVSESDPTHSTVIYGGTTSQTRKNGQVLSWQNADRFIEKTLAG